MKKIAIVVAFACAAVSSSFGQGQIQIFNSSSATTKIFFNNVGNGWATNQVGAAITGTAGTWMFELFVNTTTNSGAGQGNVAISATPWTTAGWVDTTQFGTNSGTAGRVSEFDPSAAGSVGISQLGVGIWANLEMIGWNTAVGGNSLSSFIAAYNSNAAGLDYGFSGVANEQLGDGGVHVGNSNFFVTGSGGVTGFTLAPITPVPEPTTIALAGLGGLALLGLRRRK